MVQQCHQASSGCTAGIFRRKRGVSIGGSQKLVSHSRDLCALWIPTRTVPRTMCRGTISTIRSHSRTNGCRRRGQAARLSRNVRGEKMQKISPWVGDLYRSEGLFGCRVLLLGESNYDPARSSSDTDYANIVIENVQSCVFNGRVTFFTKAARLLLMVNEVTDMSAERVRDVWKRVAFHNLIQHVFSGPRIRPLPKMWEAGRQALAAVLNDLKPDLVVVMGTELASNIDPHSSFVQIAHPSSFGFQYAPWVTKLRTRWPNAPNKAMQATCEDACA